MSTQKDLDIHHYYKITPAFACSYYLIKNPTTPNRNPFYAPCPHCEYTNTVRSRIKKTIKCYQCNSEFSNPYYINNENNGTMSKKAKGRFRSCFNWLMLISNNKTVYSRKEKKRFSFKINFITLTLPSTQSHSDYVVKEQMLAAFLRWMNTSWDVRSYIWKAEAQKNGNIHFHITTNKFIHWKSVRTKWNRILSKYGYCKVYQDGSNDKGDSATQIKAVKNTKQIQSYMMKYMMKSEKDKRKINGKLWGASENLNESAMIIEDTMPPYELVNKWLNIPYVCEKKITDHCTMYFYKGKVLEWVPPSVRIYFTSQIQKLKEKDGIQTHITIDSFYN